MKYANIVFLQDFADLALHILDTEGAESVVYYLAQWDYGTESEHDVRNESSAGSEDYQFGYRIFEGFGSTPGIIDMASLAIDDYVVTYNLRLGYIGLERIVAGDE